MKRLAVTSLALSGMLAAVSFRTAGAAEQTAPVRIDDQGTVHITDFAIPLSSYMSAPARKEFIEGTRDPGDPAWGQPDAPIEKLRAMYEAGSQELLKQAQARYAVNIEPRDIGGVHTKVVTPKAGVPADNKHRVLIELHGGGFFTGGNGQALVESVPVAATGGFEVVAVDYREGPENKYPAATEDVAAVYKALLRDHKPAQIGLYGCGAGGTLSAMAVAWFQKERLPRPGAVGIFSAGAYGNFDAPPGVPGSWGGDSRYTAPPLTGDTLLPPDPSKTLVLPRVMGVYLREANLSDPLVSPGLYPDVLAKFPPTLVLTSTRGFDMSAAVQTHRELVKAGVDARLHVWDGLSLCFFNSVDLPESQEAFTVMTQFFDHHLGK